MFNKLLDLGHRYCNSVGIVIAVVLILEDKLTNEWITWPFTAIMYLIKRYVYVEIKQWGQQLTYNTMCDVSLDINMGEKAIGQMQCIYTIISALSVV